MNRLLKVGVVLAVLVLAAGAVGGAVTSAQEGDGPISGFLAKVAEKLGVSQDELQNAIDEASIETIDEAVANGQLTEEQAARLKERAADGGFMFPLGGMHFGREAAGVLPEAAAETLGITEDQLMEELRGGQSLAEIAEAQGMSVDDLEAGLLAQVKAQLDSKVADGTLTQVQADEMFERIEGTIGDIANAEGCLGGFGGHGPGPGRFGGPWSGPPSDEPSESTEAAATAAY